MSDLASKLFRGRFKTFTDGAIILSTVLFFLMNLVFQINIDLVNFDLFLNTKTFTIILLIFAIVIENFFAVYREYSKDEEARTIYKILVHLFIIFGITALFVVNPIKFKYYSIAEAIILYMINLFGRFKQMRNNYYLWAICIVYILMTLIEMYVDASDYMEVSILAIDVIFTSLIVFLRFWFSENGEKATADEKKFMGKIALALTIISFILLYLFSLKLLYLRTHTNAKSTAYLNRIISMNLGLKK